jgi:poly(3-hydroxybutyrate) depolymerase
MLYLLHDAYHQMLTPARALADLTRLACDSPLSLLSYTSGARTLSASCELFERSTRPYPNPPSTSRPTNGSCGRGRFAG